LLKKRVIPVLLLQNGLLVRSEEFKFHQAIGNPIHEVKRFNEWNVDELIYLDITKDNIYDLRRDDHKTTGLNDPLSILDEVSKTCFMPLTWGGKIRDIEDIKQRINRGADKVSLNTAAVERPKLITEGANIFGSQAIVISIDVNGSYENGAEVMINGGKEETGLVPHEWAKQAESYGAGEILIQSINRDGMGTGYDLRLIEEVSKSVKIPVIACSGVGDYSHYVDGINAGASAVAAANIWHFKELTDYYSKQTLLEASIDVRI